MLRQETLAALVALVAPRERAHTAGHDDPHVAAPPADHPSQPFSNASIP